MKKKHVKNGNWFRSTTLPNLVTLDFKALLNVLKRDTSCGTGPNYRFSRSTWHVRTSDTRSYGGGDRKSVV